MSGALPPGAETLKREETDARPDDTGTAQEAETIPTVTMTTRGARASKTATPLTGAFPGDPLQPRARSTRNNGNGGPAATESNGTAAAKRGHKRGAASIAQSVHASTANSRRGSLIANDGADSEAAATISSERTSTRPQRNRRSALLHEDEAVDVNDEEDADVEGDVEEDVEGSEEGDEGEPRYCFCNEVSYGTMVGCDGDDCLKQWFHLSCVGLKEAPKSDGEFELVLLVMCPLGCVLIVTAETWFCEECLAKAGKKAR